MCVGLCVCACASVWVHENLAAQCLHIYVHVLKLGVSNSHGLTALSETILTKFIL